MIKTAALFVANVGFGMYSFGAAVLTLVIFAVVVNGAIGTGNAQWVDATPALVLAKSSLFLLFFSASAFVLAFALYAIHLAVVGFLFLLERI